MKYVAVSNSSLEYDLSQNSQKIFQKLILNDFIYCRLFFHNYVHNLMFFRN